MKQIYFDTNNKNLGISTELNQARSKKFDKEELQESYQVEKKQVVEVIDTIDIDGNKLLDTNSSNLLIKIILLDDNQKIKFTFCINSNKITAHLLKQDETKIIEIKGENAPDLKNINTQKLFESVLKNAHIKITNLSNGDIKLYINQLYRVMLLDQVGNKYDLL